jgi:hypothetical protein
MEDKTQTTKIKEALAKRLLKLQADSAAVQTVIAKTNQLEYENLAAIYLWWRAALAPPGYLEEAYKPTMVRRVFGENTGELSFRRLLYLMYGIYGLDKDSLDRKNRALLGLHAEYKKNHELYAKDGVNKLAGFIKSRGGISSLIGSSATTAAQTASSATTSHANVSAADAGTHAHGDGLSATCDDYGYKKSNGGNQAASSTTPAGANKTYRTQPVPKITDAMRVATLADEAKAFYAQQPSSQLVNINPPLATDKQGYAVAVVKRTATGYEVVSATEGGLDLKEVMVSAYSKRLDAVPYSVRYFLEVLKTQALPAPLLKLYDKLIDVGTEKHDDNSKRKSTRRVAYLAQENMLLLSPTFATSGVVTMAKLKRSPFAGDAADCFMPTRTRKLLEHRLLAANDVHMFKPQHSEHVPSFHQPGLCSHLLRLDNKANATDFMFMEFWPFEADMGNANQQLVFVQSLDSSQRAVTVDIAQSDFKTLIYDHIRPWLLSYGEHMTRPANKVLQLSMDAAGFTLQFDWVNGAFRNQASSDFAQQLTGSTSVQATCLSKDLCLALNGIADLPLTSDIQMAWSDDVLVLRYATDIADYTIAIPTTVAGRRKDTAFAVYAPSILPQSSYEPTVKQLEAEGAEDALLLESALGSTAGPMTDAEIEKLIGLQMDDYDDITEGLDAIIEFVDMEGSEQ